MNPVEIPNHPNQLNPIELNPIQINPIHLDPVEMGLVDLNPIPVPQPLNYQGNIAFPALQDPNQPTIGDVGNATIYEGNIKRARKENNVTAEDVGRATVFAQEVLERHRDLAAAPIWFQQMNHSFQQIIERLNEVDQRLNQVDQRTVRALNRIENSQTFAFNTSAGTAESNVMPLTNDNGDLPVNFPEMRLLFDSLSNAEYNRLKEFYGLPQIIPNTFEARLQKNLLLRRYLGIR